MALALKAEVHTYTHDEYLALEEHADTKSEYFKGQIFAMSGGSVNHSRIAVNVMVELGNDLQTTPCEPFNSDLRIWIRAHDLFTYPDISVICGNPDFYHTRTDTVTNPVVIFEVLSPSTQDYDRGQKFECYRSIPSLRDYVIIHQEKIAVEHHHKVGLNRWLLTEYTDPDETLLIESIDFALPIRRIYARVSELADGASVS
ncbi:MAG: Uma2 family endonuclease [Caldilineaceae bacterium]|nr:Uma2 family endonuclease [Caldilineaceae bacterium]